MRMDEHTRGTLHFWREATPTHDINFAAGKLQTPGTVDGHFRKFPLQKRVPSSHSLRARLVLGTPHSPKLSFTAISISCSEPSFCAALLWTAVRARTLAAPTLPQGPRVAGEESDEGV